MLLHTQTDVLDLRIGEIAHEPPGGSRTVRKLVAPPPNYEVDGLLVALLSHSAAIFAHAPRATRWLQWLVRKLSILNFVAVF